LPISLVGHNPCILPYCWQVNRPNKRLTPLGVPRPSSTFHQIAHQPGPSSCCSVSTTVHCESVTGLLAELLLAQYHAHSCRPSPTCHVNSYLHLHLHLSCTHLASTSPLFHSSQHGPTVTLARWEVPFCPNFLQPPLQSPSPSPKSAHSPCANIPATRQFSFIFSTRPIS
jgi:hypothetical protein